ncbi:MAG: ABC transporter substrate-binding protein [Spirochaetes bacterium]|nr:ABC transporter substrate-binding protein [Spirochaetota bacterium]
MRKPGFLSIIFAVLLFMLVPDQASAKIIKSHGFSLFGDLMYKSNFKHFNYVNPDAPKGGTYVRAVDNFDNLNPYIPGTGGAQMWGGVYGGYAEMLMVPTADEPNSAYGLIAESVTYPSDYSWAEFKIRKIARWHDGKPITAEDVIFSFNTLKEKGHPTWRQNYMDIEEAKKMGTDRVRFILSRADRALIWNLVQTLAVFNKEYWSTREFENSSLEIPVMSGPYKITKIDVGNSMTQERVKNYWGKDLPVNKGRWNFDVVRSDVYRDWSIRYEAFMAGNFDLMGETTLSRWMTGYKSDAVDKGYIVKKEYAPQGSMMFLGMGINARRDRFKDKRVREALAYAFDWDWINKTIYYNKYGRLESYFQGTELAHKGKPSGAELKLLKPFEKQVDPRVFTEQFSLPKTGAAQDELRKNLRIASELLKEAGWTPKGGKLVNSKGEEFTVEFLLQDPNQESLFAPFIDNLKRLGVNASMQRLDPTAFWPKYWAYDWDICANGLFPHSLSPGAEFRNYWGSAAADMSPSFNTQAIKNPVVDTLIEKVVNAKNRPEKLTACRALDRVLCWEFYSIPLYYWNKSLTAYWDRFGFPEKLPEWTRNPFSGDPDALWIDKKKDEVINKMRASKR